ncbi:MAG: hypothetical protein ABWX96_14050 [Propionibacteriaceae bacterium]
MPSSAEVADYSDRDRSITVNSYTTVKGRSSVPEEKFRAYWRDVHGPLCSRVPALGWYVQHHFASRRDTHLWPLPDGVTALPGYQLDGAVEIGWDTVEAQAEFQDASPILFSDEQNVFDETVAYALPTGSETAFDRQPDPIPNGADPYDRMHVHFTPRPGREADLAQWLRTSLAVVAAASADVVKLRTHAPETVDNSVPSPPAPNVRHEVVTERLTLVIAEIAFTNAIARRRFFASDGYVAAAAGLGELASHLTAFPVSGVFTFVRDGQLTTAGLRGSRVAELIDDLAALNQVGDDVWHLMHTGQLG